MPPFWLYRGGVNAFTLGPHHVIFSETWVTPDPPVSDVNTRNGIHACTNRLTSPFGGFTPESRPWSSLFWEQLWPRPTRHESPINTEPFSLNPAAPEAAFRLQRVGAVSAIGLIRLPIMDDGTFTDRPHRRHVDLATYAPALAAVMGSDPMTVTSGGRTYHNVVFNRRTFLWEAVASYRLERSTCRVWQRSHIFPPARIAEARAYVVPEPDNWQVGD